jgi:uncharacterized protein (TIGR03790 family)
MHPLRLSLVLVGIVFLTDRASALGPDDVYLVTNKNVPESKGIAEHYCARRKVPLDHILVLDLPKGEDISRKDYNEKFAAPLREMLKERKDKVKVLLTIYGVPLRVGPATPSADEQKEIEKLRKDVDPLQKEQKELREKIAVVEKKLAVAVFSAHMMGLLNSSLGQGPFLLSTQPVVGKIEKIDDASKTPDLKELPKFKTDLQKLDARLRPLEDRRLWLSDGESSACVDSELALLWWPPYELRRWQLNVNYFQVPDDIRKERPAIVMTCRLDGPSVDLIKKIVDTSVEVEAKGLSGKVYVDARGIRYDPKADPGFGYGGYDESMREMAKLLRDVGKMDVTLDDKPALFAEGSCPDCALYCGWYSLARYVDCCKFVPGAVAWHLASSEAVSLRNPKATFWCKNLLEKGVVATLGPVSEPYTVGFPKPAEFFGFLATGEYTLVECYWRTEMLASWMTVLVGDPLYNPYAKAPKLKASDVKPSPAGGSFKVLRNTK